MELGSLVELYRRKKPGIGIVLAREEDAMRRLDTTEEWEAFIEMYSQAQTWPTRSAACRLFTERSGFDADFTHAFLLHNSFYGSNAKLTRAKMKTDFVLVHWLKRPSDYESDTLYATKSWLPTDWFRKVSPEA